MLVLETLGEEVIVHARRKRPFESIHPVLDVDTFPDVRRELEEHLVVRHVQLLRREVVVAVEDDVLQVTLIVRALVEDDKRGLAQNASYLVVRSPEVLLVVHVPWFHRETDRNVNRWR
jgi:hypothetical protein